MASLIEMPEHILDKVIGHSDFKDVLSLRQVCRDFRNFIDNSKDSKLPDSKFVKIEISCMKDEIISKIEDSDDSSHEIEYSKTKNSRKYQEKKTMFKNSNIVDVVVRDLEWILKFQKSTFEEVSFYLDDIENQNDTSIHTLLNKLNNIINASGRKIKTTELSISTGDKSPIIQMLQFADPETLKIIQMEQWKKAKELKCDFRVVNWQVDDISHFSKITIAMNSISARDLDFLRKAFLTSSKAKRWFFEMRMFNENQEILRLWGPAFDIENSRQWYFRMKDSEKEEDDSDDSDGSEDSDDSDDSDYFEEASREVLRIVVFQEDHFEQHYHIRFNTFELRAVPDRAIVHNYNGN
ncbi:unnamed protein product [Caenorhabditis nigoni]